jgi:hypothetical protein
MSEIIGPFTAVASIVEDHRRLNPIRQKIAHAGYGAELLFWCYWLAPAFEHETGTPFNAWAAVSGFGALWLGWALWAGRANPRDVVAAWWALIFGCGAAALWWLEIYPSDWGPVAVYFLRGFYVSIMALNAAHFVVAAQIFGFNGRARRIVDRQRRRRERPMRPAG